ncbi:type IV pilus assembly protein PilM [Pistricoccus aurantiacus]|uniref:Type IV pilus assembly protein PilM n=1 Tax=Pistricoccus aurantiacus TaxID=1883414 RepID=A0A5B8SRA3_9GAMM|nr:type IV pilus assembly protein PilM [Pistricoccus aurantiacus]QEA37965.1 type IV pilus assembly protein PilM [Pistricoccus aurantiacus]
MVLLSFGKSRGCQIGVDITSSAIKLIELKSTCNGFQVISYAVVPLREDAVVEHRIRDVAEVTRVLERVLEAAKPISRNTCVAVPASAAITKIITVPAAFENEEIERHIELESDKHIPFPFNEVAFDFQRLGLSAKQADQQEVLLVASRQQNVTQLTEVLENVGLVPVAVDVESFAVERVFAEMVHHQLGSQVLGEAVALVDIGAMFNTFYILHAGSIVYRRDTSYGGRQLTDEIRMHYGLSMSEAGFAKKRGGLPEDYDSTILSPFVDTLVQQVARSLQLYYAGGHKREVDRLLLSGGTGVLPGLRDRLAQETGIDVSLATPFAHMEIDSRIDAEALAADATALLGATGLALRTSR